MEKLKVKGGWNIIKGIVNQRLGHLFGNYPLFLKGKKEIVVGKLQYKIGKVRKEVFALFSRLKSVAR